MQTQKSSRTRPLKSSKSTRRRRKDVAGPEILESPPVASPPTPVVPAAPQKEVEAPPEHAAPAESLLRSESTGEELFEPGHWLKLLGQWTEETVFKMLFHRRTP